MKFDLHLHSEYSWDSEVKIKDYITKAEQLNYDVISITDHNNIESHSLIDKLQPDTEVYLIPGQEVSTLDGHLLVYGWIDALPTGLSMSETVTIAKKFSSICIAAHPFDPFRGGSFSKIFETGIDGFELLNASSWFNFPNWLAKRAHNNHPGYLGFANSDSHRLDEFGSAYSEISLNKNVSEFNEYPEQVFHSMDDIELNGSRIGIIRKISRLLRRF